MEPAAVLTYCATGILYAVLYGGPVAAPLGLFGLRNDRSKRVAAISRVGIFLGMMALFLWPLRMIQGEVGIGSAITMLLSFPVSTWVALALPRWTPQEQWLPPHEQ